MTGSPAAFMRFPFFSLILLLGSYSTFSWFLYQVTVPKIVWLLALLLALLQASLLTAFSKGVRASINRWLKSDIGYFSVVALGALSIAVILVWYHIFEYFLVTLAAEILARLDLQNAGFNDWQTLGILTVISIAGLAVGWSASHTVVAQLMQGFW